MTFSRRLTFTLEADSQPELGELLAGIFGYMKSCGHTYEAAVNGKTARLSGLDYQAGEALTCWLFNRNIEERTCDL